MKINIDRLCKLAGVPTAQGNNILREGAEDRNDEGIPALIGRAALSYGARKALSEDEMDDEMAEELEEEYLDHDLNEEDLDEIIEIDEVTLVQELRRAKKLMAESRRRKIQTINESKEFQRIVREEIANMFENDEYNDTTGQWVYGNRKPRRSKKGYSHQGSYLPGIGFK